MRDFMRRIILVFSVIFLGIITITTGCGREKNVSIDELNKIPDLYYKGLKIWADQTAKLYPYGYPFSYVSTQIHQYILSTDL